MSRTPNIVHVVWDWNGTLLDDAEACVASLNVMLRRRGLSEITLRHYQETFDFPVRNFYIPLGFDVSDSHWDAIAREYHALYGEFSRTSPLRHGAVETLAALRDRGFVQSVLSASEQAILEGAIVQRGIRDFFGQVGGLPDLYAHSKIHLGRRVIGDAETAAGQTLIVGDTTHDYEVSQELGCPCVLLAGGHQSPQRLSRCACPLFEDFAGLGNYLLRLARRSRSDRPTDAAAEI